MPARDGVSVRRLFTQTCFVRSSHPNLPNVLAHMTNVLSHLHVTQIGGRQAASAFALTRESLSASDASASRTDV